MSILPLLLGFSLLATAYFYETEHFKDLTKSMITFYAMYHGDSVHVILHDIVSVSNLLALLFMMTFVMIFAVGILNFFCAVNE